MLALSSCKRARGNLIVGRRAWRLFDIGQGSKAHLDAIVRPTSLVASGMVMAARPMYENIGVHWTMTLLGCVATILAPFPLFLKRNGQKLREKSQFAADDYKHWRDCLRH